MICRECGVEFEDTVTACPLCGLGVSDPRGEERFLSARAADHVQIELNERHLLGQVLWQITSVLLISGIASTLIVNFSVNGAVTWAVYPVTICLIFLTYTVPMTLGKTSALVRILLGWLLSSPILVGLNALIPSNWPVALALPVLSAINLIALLIVMVSRRKRRRSIEVFAAVFFAVTLFCVFLDATISFHRDSLIRVSWSVIVAACSIPVGGTVLFLYFRMKKNTELKKIFHT